jgi:hypothetical protein
LGNVWEEVTVIRHDGHFQDASHWANYCWMGD